MALECKTLNLDLVSFIIHGIFPVAKVKTGGLCLGEWLAEQTLDSQELTHKGVSNASFYHELNEGTLPPHFGMFLENTEHNQLTSADILFCFRLMTFFSHLQGH